MPSTYLTSANIINRANPYRAQSRLINTAVGGSIVDSGIYRYHIYTATGTFFTPNDRTADALIIGGGGSGGIVRAGGGGGGAVIYYRTLRFAEQTTYSITVGSGGVGTSQTSGGNSSVVHRDGTETAEGGGRGSPGYGSGGANGGCGGGGSGDAYGGGSTNISSSMGWHGGFGTASSTYSWCGGGGGGATSNGARGDQSAPRGTGGNGFLLDTVTLGLSVFSGMTYVSSGGGGGSYDGTCGNASTAGGGNGSINSTGGNATSYGSGGGGGGRDSSYGGNGYQGIVILRYLK